MQGEEVTIKFTDIKGWTKVKSEKLRIPAMFKKASKASAAPDFRPVSAILSPIVWLHDM